MKDYIILAYSKGVKANNITSWDINQSSFRNMEPGNKLTVRMVSCGVRIINPTLDFQGIIPIYCNLSSANQTSDLGYTLLGTVNVNVVIDTPDTLLISDYLEFAVPITTGQFSKISLFAPDEDDPTINDNAFFNTVVLEITYSKN